MSKRKGWDELSDDYRKRLQRKGITKGQYESGVSIKGARGHSNTPERPADAYTPQGRKQYKDYLERAKTLREIVFGRKVEMFANRFKWDEERARKYVLEGGTEVPKPGVKELEAALSMTQDEIEQLIADPNVDSKWKFLWYH